MSQVGLNELNYREVSYSEKANNLDLCRKQEWWAEHGPIEISNWDDAILLLTKKLPVWPSPTSLSIWRHMGYSSENNFTVSGQAAVQLQKFIW